MQLFAVVLGDDEVEGLTHNAALRWDSAALVPGPQACRGRNPAVVRDL